MFITLQDPDGTYESVMATMSDVLPPQMFEFMASEVSSEKPKALLVARVADRLKAARARGVVSYKQLSDQVDGLLVEDGARGTRQVVPASWIDDIVEQGDAAAWAAGSFAAYYPGLPMRYRSQWYVVDGPAPLLFGMGIHGQNLFVDRRRAIVIAKVSSQALPIDAARITLTMRAASEIMAFVAGEPRQGGMR